MTIRKKILFIINNEVVVEETQDLDIVEVEKMKRIIAEECECCFEDVNVEYEDVDTLVPQECSEIDVTSTGLVDWKDPDFKDLNKGIVCTLIEGSDEHLEAISNGTLLDHLNFF